MNKVIGFLVGLLTGALVGGVLALLFAPYSGEVTRLQLRERAQYVQDEVKRAAYERRAELEQQLAELRAPRPPVKGPTPS
jgi:gas vesicle protein